MSAAFSTSVFPPPPPPNVRASKWLQTRLFNLGRISVLLSIHWKIEQTKTSYKEWTEEEISGTLKRLSVRKEETSWALKFETERPQQLQSVRAFLLYLIPSSIQNWSKILYSGDIGFGFTENEPFLASSGKGEDTGGEVSTDREKALNSLNRAETLQRGASLFGSSYQIDAGLTLKPNTDSLETPTQACWWYPPSDGTTRKCLSETVCRGWFLCTRTSWCQVVFFAGSPRWWWCWWAG